MASGIQNKIPAATTITSEKFDTVMNAPRNIERATLNPVDRSGTISGMMSVVATIK